jgi:osmoprotectant transport system ATP-binding protein
VISFSEVGFTYPAAAAAALRRFSLTVGEGELVALVGPSGCGKSTALKLVNRLLDPTEGRVLVDGKQTTSSPAVELRQRIGVVFQHGGLFPHFSVGENLWLMASLAGWDPAGCLARARELMDVVGLDPQYLSRYPQDLSGGQRQRVAFARAVFLRQKVVLLDEPFSALDPLSRDDLQRFFREQQQRQGLTVLMVTHDMSEALLMADRIAVMDSGQLVAEGTPHELLKRDSPELLVRLLETPLRQTRRIESLLGGSPASAPVHASEVPRDWVHSQQSA